MGSITATGSVIAYGKLSGSLSSTALALPGRDYINAGLCAIFMFVVGAITMLLGAVSIYRSSEYGEY